MTYFLINLLLAILWASLQAFRPTDVVGGLVIGYMLLWLLRNWLGPQAAHYVRWVPTFIRFIFYYNGLLATSTWDVVKMLFRDQRTLKPGIIALPLEAKTDLEIVLLNNLLSLTPGTLGVDLSPDRAVLYVHVINVPDPAAMIESIKTGLERRLLEVLR
jgi:multicomponent Na+:H+ antiporter subunit E